MPWTEEETKSLRTQGPSIYGITRALMNPAIKSSPTEYLGGLKGAIENALWNAMNLKQQAPVLPGLLRTNTEDKITIPAQERIQEGYSRR